MSDQNTVEKKPSIHHLGAVLMGVRNLTESAGFISHGMDHLDRVANGASYFTSLETSENEAMYTAFVAGLIHDLNRPKSESEDHTQSSEDSAREFLKGFDCDGSEDEIVRLVANHRTVSNGSIRDRSVFIADKILEQMGAYLAFRGSVYVAEVDDFLELDGVDLVDAYVDLTRRRMGKFAPETFPPKLQRLAKKQMKWVDKFLDALDSRDDWAMNLATYCHAKSRNPNGIKSLEPVIIGYEPLDRNDFVYKAESVRYLTFQPKYFAESL